MTVACLSAAAAALWLPTTSAPWDQAKGCGSSPVPICVPPPGEPHASPQIRVPPRNPSAYTPFPPATMAATQPICFGDLEDLTVWIGKRGVGLSPSIDCKTPPTRWANLHRPVSQFGNPQFAPPRQMNLSVVRTLYRVARRYGFATLPTRLGKPWQLQQATCWRDCMADYDFIQFGGRKVYDGYGYAEGWACNHSKPPSSGFTPIRVTEWTKRFARLFATLAALTPFCSILDHNWPAE